MIYFLRGLCNLWAEKRTCAIKNAMLMLPDQLRAILCIFSKLNSHVNVHNIVLKGSAPKAFHSQLELSWKQNNLPKIYV